MPITAWTNYRGQARGLRGRGCRRAAGQSVQQAPGAPARCLAPRIAHAAGSSYHIQRHLLGTRTARDARLFGPAHRRPAQFIGKRRTAKRHKIGRAGGCRRASAGHGNFHGHTHLKRPCTPSGGPPSRPCHHGCNDTFPNRSFGACTHTPLKERITDRHRGHTGPRLGTSYTSGPTVLYSWDLSVDVLLVVV